MSARDKQSLDDIEAGGYQPIQVGIKVNGRHEAAFVHVPLEALSTPRPPLRYLDILIEGAAENQLTAVVRELGELRREVLEQRSAT
jgi:hypothetical protein